MPKGKIRLIKRIMKIPSHSELFKAFKGTDVVKTLTEKELNLIQEHIKFIPYKKGETIYKQGNRITDMAINMNGLVKIFIENKSHDRNTIVSLQLPISLIGPTAFYDDVHKTTAEAMSNSIIAFFDVKIVQELVKENPKFMEAMFKLTCNRMNLFMKQIADLGQKQIRARMATVLLIIADLIGQNKIDIHISRNELSEYAGISTGSAIRLLSDLEKEGIIKLDKKNIDIVNRKKLEEISQVDD